MKATIASIRQEYLLATLNEADIHTDPFQQFQKWFHEAVNASVDDANAMILGTVSANNTSRSRIVLLKDLENNQFVFYTNYLSHKAYEIEHNPNVSLTFFWKELQRQVRIEGTAGKISEQVSTEYFKERPRESQLGAWASYQSELLESREILEKRYADLEIKYRDTEIPKPPHWGGFAVAAQYLEFWQGRSNRLHDRICFSRQHHGDWLIQRMNP